MISCSGTFFKSTLKTTVLPLFDNFMEKFGTTTLTPGYIDRSVSKWRSLSSRGIVDGCAAAGGGGEADAAEDDLVERLGGILAPYHRRRCLICFITSNHPPHHALQARRATPVAGRCRALHALPPPPPPPGCTLADDDEVQTRLASGSSSNLTYVVGSLCHCCSCSCVTQCESSHLNAGWN